MYSFKDLLDKLADQQNLSREEARFALGQIVKGEVPDTRTAAFLFGMRAKGETVDELTAFVEVMRDAAITVEVDNEHAVDLCGTGGDHSNTFNISTSAMFVVAGAGVPVLKHGNRSVSSKSGSADVLEELGVVVDLPKEGVEQCFKEAGLVFMFAPNFHPAMKHVMPARKSLGIRTFFNILGPLLNPAMVNRQIIGAYSVDVARQMVQILANLDTKFAYTVNSHDGLDEFSLAAGAEVFQLNDSLVSDSTRFDPKSLGFELVDEKALKGGDAQHNANIIRSIVDDDAEPAHRNVVLLNAAFAIHASGKADSLEEALELATESIEGGGARKALDALAEVSTDIANSN